MFALVICIAAMAAGSPIAAALVVAVASRREDRNWSLGRPPGRSVEAIARRIVAFDANFITWPRSIARVRAEMASRRLFWEAPDADAGAATDANAITRDAA
jgi:hypothetical protein